MKRSIHELAVPILALPRAAKRLVALAVDLTLCVLTVWIAYYLRLGEFVAISGNALWAVVASIGFALPTFIVSGLYRAIFRYSGWPALLSVARAVGIYGLLYASVFTAIGISEVPRTVGLIQPMLLMLVVGASRGVRCGNHGASTRQSHGKQPCDAGGGISGRRRPFTRS
jgi:FlaA1/EpsC-like NDP-sugar epimerase